MNAGFVATPMVTHRTAAMPQLLSAEAAAQHIADALARRLARIDFPSRSRWVRASRQRSLERCATR